MKLRKLKKKKYSTIVFERFILPNSGEEHYVITVECVKGLTPRAYGHYEYDTGIGIMKVPYSMFVSWKDIRYNLINNLYKYYIL